MKVNYKFKNDGNGDIRINSNLIVNGLDLLDLLGSDVGERTYKDFLTCIRKKERWWSNATRVEFEGDHAIIYPAFQWEDDDQEETKATLKVTELKKILKEWIIYLENNPYDYLE